MRRLAFALWAMMTTALSAQTIEGPVFDVVSLKKLAFSGVIQPMTGGPGTATPTRASMIFTARAFVNDAFALPSPQLITDGKLPEDFYEFAATVPEGATKEDFRTMVRNMLIERFHLRYHRETREIKRFELLVAEGGHKLRGASNEPPAEVPKGGFSIKPSDDGYMVFQPGRNGGPAGSKGRWAMQRVGITMDELARDLGGPLRAPVANKTDIRGTFDLRLRWMEANPTAAPTDATEFTDPPLIPAIRQQLGLVLREGKGPVEVIVIDAFDKEATPN